MDFELKQGDVIELENGEHWLYGENVSYRLDKDVNPRYWYNAEFDDNMKTRGLHEQVVRIWGFNFCCGFDEIVDKLSYLTPLWTYKDNRFKVGDIVRITFFDDDIMTYFVNKDGFLVTLDGAEIFCNDKFPTYDRIKNSDVVTKVELMKLATEKEL